MISKYINKVNAKQIHNSGCWDVFKEDKIVVVHGEGKKKPTAVPVGPLLTNKQFFLRNKERHK